MIAVLGLLLIGGLVGVVIGIAVVARTPWGKGEL